MGAPRPLEGDLGASAPPTDGVMGSFSWVPTHMERREHA